GLILADSLQFAYLDILEVYVGPVILKRDGTGLRFVPVGKIGPFAFFVAFLNIRGSLIKFYHFTTVEVMLHMTIVVYNSRSVPFADRVHFLAGVGSMHIVVAAYQLLVAKFAIPTFVIHNLVLGTGVVVVLIFRILDYVIQNTTVAAWCYLPVN